MAPTIATISTDLRADETLRAYGARVNPRKASRVKALYPVPALRSVRDRYITTARHGA